MGSDTRTKQSPVNSAAHAAVPSAVIKEFENRFGNFQTGIELHSEF